jgi:hypothetical protein
MAVPRSPPVRRGRRPPPAGPALNLPPIPPVGGETTGRTVVDVLTEQHRELLALCDRLAEGRTGAAPRRSWWPR